MVESICFLKPAWCGTHFAGLWPEQGFQPVTRATALRRWFVTPLPTNSDLTNNYLPSYSNQRVSQIPSVKIDHSLSGQLKLSGYWARTQTDSPNNAGLAYPLSNTVGSH